MMQPNPFTRKRLHEELNIIAPNQAAKFTITELDVIACIVFSEHNHNSDIAVQLSIAVASVDSHIRNIRKKLHYVSKSQISELVAKYHKLSELEAYYNNLKFDCLFKARLKEIQQILKGKNIKCNIIGSNLKAYSMLWQYLKAVSIQLLDKDDQLSNQYPNIIVSNTYDYKYINNQTVYIVFDEQNLSEYENIKFLNFNESNNLYLKIFELISFIIQSIDISEFIKKFEKQYKNILIGLEKKDKNKLFVVSRLSNYLSQKSSYTLAVMVGFILVYLINYTFLHLKPNLPYDTAVRSDLSLPNKAMLLERSNILIAMDKKLAGNGIQTIVLIGLAGAGKTTIASHYALKQKAAVVWKIECETKSSLIASFEQLAWTLCNNKEDTEELKIIEAMPQNSDMQSRLYLFITKKMRANPNWLLIFDNLVSFKDIEQFYPFSSVVWGPGKIIITSRDKNIDKNVYINSDDIIVVDELTTEEKLELFSRIVYGKKDIHYNTEELRNFLSVIPPFPFDVSTAAYYIKNTGISFNKYLANVKEPDKSFIETQEGVLQNVSNYAHTRDDIVSLSIQDLVNKNPEYENLILFVSMVDSQNIPKNLLVKHADNTVVTSLLRDLQKVALISIDKNNLGDITFSLHRAIQPIVFKYLINKLNLDSDSSQIEDIISTIESYINTEVSNGNLAKSCIIHLESLLKNKNILNELMQIRIQKELGNCYRLVGQYEEAARLLTHSLEFYTNFKGKNNIETARVQSYLGEVLINLGRFHEAEKYLKQSLKIYSKELGETDDQTTGVLLFLGNVSYENGNFAEAEKYYLKCLQIRQAIHGPNHIKAVEPLGLGDVYRQRGEYFKAQQLLEHALNVYEFYYGKNHYQISRVLIRLGKLYRDIGNLELAKDTLKRASQIRISSYSYNHPFVAKVLVELSRAYRDMGHDERALHLLQDAYAIEKNYYVSDDFQIVNTMIHLGNMLRSLQSYDRSQELLEKAVSIYEKQFGNNHIKTLDAKLYLGNLYNTIHDTANAEKTLVPVYNFFQQIYSEDHINLARVRGVLGKLYIDVGRYKEANALLNQALSAYKNHFGAEHIRTLWIYFDLVDSYKYLGDFDEAEKLLKDGIDICNKNYTGDNVKIKKLEIQLSQIRLYKESRLEKKLINQSQAVE